MTQRSANVNPWLVAVAVSLATFMEVLDTTITNVSLTHIAGSLAASQDESTWVLTSYLVANGMILPLSGWLAGVVGRKRYFMVSIALFTLASFACGAATSLPMLIVFRLLQGLAGGGLQPMQQAIILDAFPIEKRAQAFGLTSITIIVAPILGPTLGGLITDNYSWRWIFYLNVPVGMFALWMVNRFVNDPDHAKAQAGQKIDYIGLGLIAIGLGALQIMLDKGQQEDWFDSNFIIAMAVISFTCLGTAMTWLLRQKDPVVELRMLKTRGFGLACLMIFFTGFALYGSAALLPIMVQSQFGYDATLSGLVISPGGFFVIIMMPIVAKLVGKFPAKYLIMIGMFLTGLGMLHTASVTPQTNYATFAWMRVSQVLGLPFLFIPISTLAFQNIPKEKSSKASALYSLARNLGGSGGIAIITAYLARRQQIHQTYLTDHLAATDIGYTGMLARYTQTIIDRGYDLATAGRYATGKVYQELLHQAGILSFHDAFLFMAEITFVLVLVTFALPNNKPKAKVDLSAAH